MRGLAKSLKSSNNVSTVIVAIQTPATKHNQAYMKQSLEENPREGERALFFLPLSMTFGGQIQKVFGQRTLVDVKVIFVRYYVKNIPAS